MIKAHVFKYSQVILTKRELAIIKFSEYSGLSSIPDIATMAQEEEKPNGIIDQYKTGKITTAQFRKKMNELIQEKNSNPIRDNEVLIKAGMLCAK
nr:hypothetical protein [Rickettsia massiliae]